MKKIAYDVVLRRPGCVLLQAVMQCDPTIAHKFETEDWLIAPTPDLKVYSVDDEQLQKLVVITERHRHEQSTRRRNDELVL